MDLILVFTWNIFFILVALILLTSLGVELLPALLPLNVYPLPHLLPALGLPLGHFLLGGDVPQDPVDGGDAGDGLCAADPFPDEPLPVQLSQDNPSQISVSSGRAKQEVFEFTMKFWSFWASNWVFWVGN